MTRTVRDKRNLAKVKKWINLIDIRIQEMKDLGHPALEDKYNINV